MLDETLVVWTTEFGRTPFTQSDANTVGGGRDHNMYGFSVWLAGGGLKLGEHRVLPEGRTERIPAANLLLSILQSFGLEVDRFGTSTGTISKQSNCSGARSCDTILSASKKDGSCGGIQIDVSIPSRIRLLNSVDCNTVDFIKSDVSCGTRIDRVECQNCRFESIDTADSCYSINDRSEERRVGKESRSRGSPYH